MGNVLEVQLKSTGFAGATGWNTFHFLYTDETAATESVHFLQDQLGGIATFFPNTWSGIIETPCKVLDEATGALQSYFNPVVTGIATATPGSSGSDYGPATSGICINWSTSELNRDRLIRGRTFFVPCFPGVYQGDGSIHTTWRTNAGSLAASFVAGPNGFAVWSRPRAHAGGKAALVTSAQAMSQPAVLRSRRPN